MGRRFMVDVTGGRKVPWMRHLSRQNPMNCHAIVWMVFQNPFPDARRRRLL